MPHRNLVIVRAGDASLHPAWLEGPEPRTWDLVVSYFGNDPDRYRTDGVVRIDAKGPKLKPLQALLTAQPEYIDGYDYIWLPDDDLAMTKADMNRFFEICREHEFELAQPSLTPDSPVTHPMLINNTRSRIRFTNFVEMMAPCFSAACLRRALPTFARTQTGWGVDWLWPEMVSNKRTGLAVVDEVVIRHTRPLGGPLYDEMRAAGKSPHDELRAFWKAAGITMTRVEIHRVVWKSGQVSDVTGPSIGYGVKLGLGYVSAMLVSPARWLLLLQTARLIKRPFMSPATAPSRI